MVRKQVFSMIMRVNNGIYMNLAVRNDRSPVPALCPNLGE